MFPVIASLPRDDPVVLMSKELFLLSSQNVKISASNSLYLKGAVENVQALGITILISCIDITTSSPVSHINFRRRRETEKEKLHKLHLTKKLIAVDSEILIGHGKMGTILLKYYSNIIILLDSARLTCYIYVLLHYRATLTASNTVTIQSCFIYTPYYFEPYGVYGWFQFCKTIKSLQL